jgi:hypothetical protein
MIRAGELRQRAELYRRLGLYINDAVAVQALSEMVGEFELDADEREARHIRERAYEIWTARGLPDWTRC